MHRKEFLDGRLFALCGPAGRLVPPRGMGEAAQKDELAALARAISGIAPSFGYESWWTRFEDVLLGGLNSRAWPAIADVRRAGRELQEAARAGAARPGLGAADENPQVYEMVEQWWLRFGAPGPGAMARARHAQRLVEAGHASWGRLWRAGFPIPDWARREAMAERDGDHERILGELLAMGAQLSGQRISNPLFSSAAVGRLKE